MSRRHSYGRLTGRPARRRNERLYAERGPLCETPGCFNPIEEWDHRIPLHRGGEESEANLQGLCRPCHAAKTAGERRTRKPPPEWEALVSELAADALKRAKGALPP